MDLGAPRDGDMPEGLGIYLVGDSFSRTLGATDRNDQFKVTTVGLTGGIEYGFGSGMVGAAVNVSRPKANFANDRFRDEAKAIQGGVYGGIGIAGGFVQGYGAIGRVDHDLTREGVISQLDADTEGNHLTAGIKAGYLMPVGASASGPSRGSIMPARGSTATPRRAMPRWRSTSGASACRRFAAASAPKCAATSPAAGSSFAPMPRRWSKRISAATTARSPLPRPARRESSTACASRRSKKAYGRLSVGPERGDPVERVDQRQRVGDRVQGRRQRDHGPRRAARGVLIMTR